MQGSCTVIILLAISSQIRPKLLFLLCFEPNRLLTGYICQALSCRFILNLLVSAPNVIILDFETCVFVVLPLLLVVLFLIMYACFKCQDTLSGLHSRSPVDQIVHVCISIYMNMWTHTYTGKKCFSIQFRSKHFSDMQCLVSCVNSTRAWMCHSSAGGCASCRVRLCSDKPLEYL